MKDQTRSLDEAFDIAGVSTRLAECLSSIVIVIDVNKRVQIFNHAAERLALRQAVDVVGAPVSSVHKVLAVLDEKGLIDRTLQLGVPSEMRDICISDASSRNKFYFAFVIDPLLDRAGEIAGAVIMAFDETEVVRLRSVLAHQNEDLVILHQISNVLRSTMDVDKSLFIICTALTSVGNSRNDHAMVFLADEKRSVLRGVMAAGRCGDREIWKVWNDLLDPQRSLQGVLEAGYPKIYKSMTRLTKRIEKIEVPIDEKGMLLAEVVRRKRIVTGESLKRGESKVEVHPDLKRRFQMTSFAAMPMMVENDAIGIFIANCSRTPRVFKGQSLKVLEMFADQAALALNNGLLFRRIAERAERDSLTGLFNHGHFQARLSAELDRARRYGEEVSLLLFDIDYFKHFNDSYGHQTGDEVLVGIGKLLNAAVRVSDVAARYGGEEFVVVLPHTANPEASALAERIRQRIATSTLATGNSGEGLQVTVSTGVATFPAHSDSAEELIAAADAAMYAAKHAGRNRVVSAESASNTGN